MEVEAGHLCYEAGSQSECRGDGGETIAASWDSGCTGRARGSGIWRSLRSWYGDHAEFQSAAAGEIIRGADAGKIARGDLALGGKSEYARVSIAVVESLTKMKASAGGIARERARHHVTDAGGAAAGLSAGFGERLQANGFLRR